MTPLVIDTDPGVDDALALLVAWGSPEVTVEAITTVAGNAPVDRCTLNVFRLLDLRRPKPRPVVAVGADRPLVRRLETAEAYHGADGLGDILDWPGVDVSPAPQPAADVLVAMARRHAGRQILIALGPLTNVAMAVEADAAAMRRIDRVVAMGGAVDVAGNVTPTAEFNFHVDPEAAARVLAAGLHLDLVPLDATRHATLTRDDLQGALRALPGSGPSRVAAFTRRAFAREGDRLTLHDPLAVGAALDETLITWEPVRLEVGPDGETRRVAGPVNCRVARDVDRRRFMRLFLERLWPRVS